ncbi:unnamed protein product, partial [Staurois parvus]
GAPVSLPTLKKAYEKGTRGISWGPLLTPGPRAGIMVLAHTQSTPPKKPIKRYQGKFMGPPTDPGPLGSAQVLKWSVHP